MITFVSKLIWIRSHNSFLFFIWARHFISTHYILYYYKKSEIWLCRTINMDHKSCFFHSTSKRPLSHLIKMITRRVKDKGICRKGNLNEKSSFSSFIWASHYLVTFEMIVWMQDKECLRHKSRESKVIHAFILSGQTLYLGILRIDYTREWMKDNKRPHF